MNKKRCARRLIAATVLLVSGLALAEWTEPVLLEELNAPGIDEQAKDVCLSGDGLTMYFMRDNDIDYEQIHEACRDVLSGQFIFERTLDELYTNHQKIYTPWVSQDQLRLYFGRYDGGTTRIIMRMAERSNTTDPWSFSKRFDSIHVNGTNDYNPTLTDDELTIYFQSNRSGVYRIYKATRPDIDSQFSNLRLASELKIGHSSGGPCLLPDGLTIYFHADVDNNTNDIYKATRTTINDPFGNIEKLWMNTNDYHESNPYVTPDEKDIYFRSDRGAMGKGIWFTHLENVIAVDIKPHSCPNPLNVKSKGVLPVAIMATEEFDVTDIDIASIRLAGIPAIRSSLEDVSQPVGATDANECACTTDGFDGFTDLVLKFKTEDIVEALINDPGQLAKGQVLTLTLTAELFDGSVIEGADCVVLVGNVPKWLAARRWDTNGDGLINMADFIVFTENWLEEDTK